MMKYLTIESISDKNREFVKLTIYRKVVKFLKSDVPKKLFVSFSYDWFTANNHKSYRYIICTAFSSFSYANSKLI